MFDKLKNMLGISDKTPKNVAPPAATKKPRAKKKKVETTLSPKEQATAKGEPYINILKVDVDPNDINNGSFELDWNDKFVINLIKAGYKMKPDDTDADIVDRWFTNICRNVVLETYEQYEAMNPERDRLVKTRNIGDGRSEVS